MAKQVCVFVCVSVCEREREIVMVDLPNRVDDLVEYDVHVIEPGLFCLPSSG